MTGIVTAILEILILPLSSTRNLGKRMQLLAVLILFTLDLSKTSLILVDKIILFLTKKAFLLLNMLWDNFKDTKH